MILEVWKSIGWSWPSKPKKQQQHSPSESDGHPCWRTIYLTLRGTEPWKESHETPKRDVYLLGMLYLHFEKKIIFWILWTKQFVEVCFLSCYTSTYMISFILPPGPLSLKYLILSGPLQKIFPNSCNMSLSVLCGGTFPFMIPVNHLGVSIVKVIYFPYKIQICKEVKNDLSLSPVLTLNGL